MRTKRTDGIRCGAVRCDVMSGANRRNQFARSVPSRIVRLKETSQPLNLCWLCFIFLATSSDPPATMDGLLAEINAKRKELESDVQAGPSKKYMRRAEVEAAKEEEDRRRRDKLRKEREEREAAKAAKARSDVSDVDPHYPRRGVAAVV